MEFKSLLVCWFFFYSSHNRRDSDDHHKFRLWQARWFAHTLGDGGWHSYFPSWLRNTPWKEKVFESVGGSGEWGESFWLLHARRPPTESSMDSRRRRCSSTLRGTEQNTQEWMRHQQGRRTTLLTLAKVFWFGVLLAAGTWWLAYNGNQSFRVLCLQTEGTAIRFLNHKSSTSKQNEHKSSIYSRYSSHLREASQVGPWIWIDLGKGKNMIPDKNHWTWAFSFSFVNTMKLFLGCFTESKLRILEMRERN